MEAVNPTTNRDLGILFVNQHRLLKALIGEGLQDRYAKACGPNLVPLRKQ
jgi:hypothetical protein